VAADCRKRTGRAGARSPAPDTLVQISKFVSLLSRTVKILLTWLKRSGIFRHVHLAVAVLSDACVVFVEGRTDRVFLGMIE
jgi:hypothetical protein